MSDYEYIDPDLHYQTPLADARPDESALDKMQAYCESHPEAKWAAFQNEDLGSVDIGHLKFLAVGPNCGMKIIRHNRMPDTPQSINWRYQFVGFVNLTTGEIR